MKTNKFDNITDSIIRFFIMNGNESAVIKIGSISDRNLIWTRLIYTNNKTYDIVNSITTSNKLYWHLSSLVNNIVVDGIMQELRGV